jgi:hypothetical protein
VDVSLITKAAASFSIAIHQHSSNIGEVGPRNRGEKNKDSSEGFSSDCFSVVEVHRTYGGPSGRSCMTSRILEISHFGL